MSHLDKKVVLVVEDDIDIMDVYKDLFGTLDKDLFSFVYAVSGSEALMKMKNQCFDILLTDYKMAKGDGLGLIEDIHSDRNIKMPYVFLVSGYLTKDVLTRIKVIAGHKLKVYLKPASSMDLLNDIKGFAG